MPSQVYNQGSYRLADRTIDWVNDTIEIIALASAYVFDADHANGTPAASEIGAIGGYVPGYGGAGRKLLATKTIAVDNATDSVGFKAANPSTYVLAAGATIGGWLVQKKGGASDATAIPIAFLDYNDFATNGVPFTVTFSADGVAVIRNGAAGSILLFCDFVKADSATTPGAATSGQALTVVGGGGEVLGIKDNALYTPNAPVGDTLDLLANVGAANVRARAVVRTTGAGFQIALRSNSDQSKAIFFYQTATQYSVFDENSNMIVALTNRAPVANDVWELEANGSTIVLRLNGVVLNTVAGITQDIDQTYCGVGVGGTTTRVASLSVVGL